MDNSGTLYLVPTPVGNLEDITLRAINVLKCVALIGAEDTRKSAFLLSHFGITTPTVSYHKFNEKSRVESFITTLLGGKDIAIITDAGTPGISDPASIIVSEAIKREIKICTLPGASAFLPALVSSGFDCRQFVFVGFLPAQTSEKKELLQRIALYPETLIFYESGQRLQRFLETLQEHLGNRLITIAREISKIYETYYRDHIAYFLEHQDAVILKGEFTIVCEGAVIQETGDTEILAQLQEYVAQGLSVSAAVTRTAKELKVAKNRVYALANKEL